MYWALDRATGDLVWSTQVGPGGTMGGLQWGSAVDNRRIYVAVNNSSLEAWKPLGETTDTNKGVWSALDKATGEVIWQTQPADPALPGLGSTIGAVTVANGVAYACSFAGSRVALDAATGNVLWSDSPVPNPDHDLSNPASIPVELCGAGAAVSRGVVYWGIGYGQIALAPHSYGSLTAYALPK